MSDENNVLSVYATSPTVILVLERFQCPRTTSVMNE